jgi:hypothetical protein
MSVEFLADFNVVSGRLLAAWVGCNGEEDVLKESRERRFGCEWLTPGQAGAQHAAPLQGLDWLRIVAGFVVVLCAVLVAGYSAAGRAVDSGARGIAASERSALGVVGADFAFGDFDGDRLPDSATVQSGPSMASRTRYWIQFDFSVGNRRSFALSGPSGGLQIVSRDVNGDSFLDLIISTRLANDPVAVLLNDGAGNFRLADAGTFAGTIWESRPAWAMGATFFAVGENAIAGAGWNDALWVTNRYFELPSLKAVVASGSQDSRYLVLPHEIRGRAPPLA